MRTKPLRAVALASGAALVLTLFLLLPDGARQRTGTAHLPGGVQPAAAQVIGPYPTNYCTYWVWSYYGYTLKVVNNGPCVYPMWVPTGSGGWSYQLLVFQTNQVLP